MSEVTASPEVEAIEPELIPEEGENVEELSASEPDSPESTEELQEAVQDAIDNGASKKEVQNMIQKFQLKVNGKTIEKEIDLSDSEAIKRELQLAIAGRQAMSETAELKKMLSQEVSRLKQDPWSVLKELGLDPDELAEMRIQSRIDEMKKSPEQIEKESLQKELEDARRKLKEKEEKETLLEQQRYQDEIAKELDDQIIAAIDSHKDISASPKIVNRIAETMLWAMENGFEDVTPEDVIPTVRNELRNEINTLLAQLPEEFLEEYIGQKNIERLRKKRINVAKNAQQVNTISNVKAKAQEVKSEKEPSKKINIDDFMRSY